MTVVERPTIYIGVVDLEPYSVMVFRVDDHS